MAQKGETQVKYSAMHYLKQKSINFELFMMCFMFAGCFASNFVTNYYLIQMQGDLYQHLYRMIAVELIAIFISSTIGNNLVSEKNQLVSKLALTALGATSVLILGDELRAFQPIFILLTKMGIYGVITQFRCSTINHFPILFQTTVLGFLVLTSTVSILFIDKFTTSMDEPWPMLIIVAFASLAIALQFLNEMKYNKSKGDLDFKF